MNSFSRKIKPQSFQMPSFRVASVPQMFDNIKVIDGSEEKIFEEVYVTGVLPNNRVVKFKKSAVVFGEKN